MPISTAQLLLNEPSESARRFLWHVLSLGVVSRDEPERHEGFDKPFCRVAARIRFPECLNFS